MANKSIHSRCYWRILYWIFKPRKQNSLLVSKPNIEDLEYKILDKKKINTEFAAKRDLINYEKFGSLIL